MYRRCSSLALPIEIYRKMLSISQFRDWIHYATLKDHFLVLKSDATCKAQCRSMQLCLEFKKVYSKDVIRSKKCMICSTRLEFQTEGRSGTLT